MTGRNDGSDAATVLDARLVPCALAAWAVTLLGLYTGWRIVTAVAVAAVVGCAVTVPSRRDRSHPTRRCADPPRRTGRRRVDSAVLAGLRMWAADQHPIAPQRKGSAGLTSSSSPPTTRGTSGLRPSTTHPGYASRPGSSTTVGGRSMDTGDRWWCSPRPTPWGDLLPGHRSPHACGRRRTPGRAPRWRCSTRENAPTWSSVCPRCGSDGSRHGTRPARARGFRGASRRPGHFAARSRGGRHHGADRRGAGGLPGGRTEEPDGRVRSQRRHRPRSGTAPARGRTRTAFRDHPRRDGLRRLRRRGPSVGECGARGRDGIDRVAGIRDGS